MAYWNRETPFQVDKAITAFADGVETPHSVSITGDNLTANSDSRKALPGGFFIALVGSDYRFLPRGTVTVAASTSAATVSVAYPEVFVAGDVLTVVEPSVYLTLSGVFDSGEAVVATIQGVAVTVTSTVNATTAAATATALAAAINAHATLKGMVKAIASGAEVHIYALDGISNYTIAASETAAAGAVAISGSQTVLLPNKTVGTISLINTTTKVITLTGSASIPVPVGAHIGVAVNDILGYYEYSIDFTKQPQKLIAPVAGSHGTYENALPYIDGDIKRRLPKLRIKSKF